MLGFAIGFMAGALTVCAFIGVYLWSLLWGWKF